jgi:hypothetical protein
VGNRMSRTMKDTLIHNGDKNMAGACLKKGKVCR